MIKHIKTWLKNFYKNIFHTQCKNLFCTILLFAIKNKYNYKQIDLYVKVFNALSRKTNFHYVRAFEKASNVPGKFTYFTQDMLNAAKPQFYYQNFKLTEIKNQNPFVLTLTSAKIFGSSNVVLASSGKAIYEPFFYDEDNRWDFTDTSIYRKIDQSFVLKYCVSKKTIPCGIMLSGNYSWNYYHFIFEYLTKFFLLDTINIPNNVPLIVDEVVNRIPQFQELLDYFNSCDREIIYIESGKSYNVETLYYISFLNIIPPNFKDVNDIKFSDCLFNLSSIQFLRNKLLPKIGTSSSNTTSSKKRIFLSRRNASSNRSYNENEVAPIFEKYDFQIVCPENHGIAEQMYLFNNASFIAGVTGAAFTNIVFCNHGCKILCMTPFQNELSVFSTIAKQLGLDLQYVSAHEGPNNTQSLHEEFEIDPTKVGNVLADFLKR